MATLLVDGYNVAHALDKRITRLQLQAIRTSTESTVLRAIGFLPKGASTQRIVFFYDGKGVSKTTEREGRHERIFMPDGESADQGIKTFIDEFPSRHSLLVISSDREIQAYARLYKVESIASSEIVRLSKFNQEPSKKPNESQLKPDSLTDNEVAEWLRLFNNNEK